MKAKITITKDLNDIPDLIVDLLREAKYKLESVSKFKFNYLDPSELAQQISSQRLVMSDVDDIFENAQNLAAGYVSALEDSASEVSKEGLDERV